MYKLENNVQWTQELKNAFKHNMTRASILYDNDEINEENKLVELTLTEERYIRDYGFIGSAIARKLNITVQNGNSPVNLENKDLTLKIGAVLNNSTYYINYGNFIVYDPPQTDETNGKTTIVAYDYMKKFDKPYEDQVNYPCTLLTLLQNICSQASVTLATTDFPNKNFVVEDNQFEGSTLREVLMNIAKCAFSWARIGQDNRLYLDFTLTAENTETITIDEYKLNAFKKSNEYYGPLNRVIYADSDIEGQEEKVEDAESIQEDGLKELVIYDNLFAYTPEKRQALIQAGTKLLGLTYMPVSQLDLIGFIYLDCNDIINIETLDNQTYTTRVFNHTIKYNGVTSDEIVSEGTSSNEEAYKNTASNIFQNQQTKAIVDRANRKINLLTSEVTDHENRISQMQIDINGIETQVSGVYDLTRKSSGVQEITLDPCMQGYLLEMHIYGNNTVFDYLFPADDLFPSDTLYPKGDSRIEVEDKDGNIVTYELRVMDVLRANEEVRDEYILKDNFAKVIRRVNPDGTTKETEEVEEIGKYTIYVSEGLNKIRIKNYVANIDAKYIIKNNYTEQFTTQIQTQSQIKQASNQIMLEVSEKYETQNDANENYSRLTQTAQEISTEVSKKVGNNEVISKINQSAEAVTINANKISLAGKTINMTSDNVAINSTNFSVDKNGNMTCTNANVSGTITSSNATISGGQINLKGNSGTTSLLRVYDNGVNNNYMSYVGNTMMGINNGSNHIELISDTPSIDVYVEGSSGTYVRYDSVTTPVVYQTNNGSDRRIKTDIKDSTISALNKIMKIKHKQFVRKTDNKYYDIGYIAQDMEKIDSNFVLINENDKNKPYYINELPIIATLTKAIQEQQEQIEELQKEIKLLKGEK